jgi:hypothetical protein
VNRLREAADAVLKALPAGPNSLHAPYDQFVWVAVTSTREELRELFQRFSDEPYIGLPPPLQVLVARLLGLEYRDDAAIRPGVRSCIAMYCDPLEERAATQGILGHRDS